MGLNPVKQPYRLTLSGNKVIPTAGAMGGGVQSKHPATERIASMMVKKQPPVQAFLLNSRLNLCKSHVVIRVFSLLTVQRMSVLRFATPALSLSSTTVNCSTSSSQSWLEPSLCWVATVNVYSWRVNIQRN